MSADWKKLLAVAYEVAKQSHDPSTRNGALLVDDNGVVLGSDYNQFPCGVQETPKRWERPLKYRVIEHAERNVIFKLARLGISTDGLTMVCPWSPCSDCARAIIQAGICALVEHKQANDRTSEFWRGELEIAHEMLHDAGVEVITYDGEVGIKGALHNGQLWNP